MKIALCGQKGGSGKSTAAMAIAAEWHRRGKKVLLIDADRQGSCVTWADIGADRDIEGPIVAAMGEGFAKKLPQLAESFDHTVIDCPGRYGSVAHTNALKVADLAIIPCGTSYPDVWAMVEGCKPVQEMVEMRDGALSACVLITRFQSRTNLGSQALEAIKGVGFSMLDSRLGFRVAYQEMPGTGTGLVQMDSSSSASKEVQALVTEIESIGGR